MIKLEDKVFNFVSLCRFRNQTEDDFANFCDRFKVTLDALSTTNSFLIVANGDFKAKSNNCYIGDTATFKNSKIEAITS